MIQNYLRKLNFVAQQDADCADGNKDVGIEATLFIPRQRAKPNQAVKSYCKTALIRLCNTYKQFSSSPINRILRRGQIVCLGSDLNQNSNLHRICQQRASGTESETALSELNAISRECKLLCCLIHRSKKYQHVCSRPNNQYHLFFLQTL